jgi:hypothetical protein
MNSFTMRKRTTALAFIVAFFSILFLKKCYSSKQPPPQTPLAMVISPALVFRSTCPQIIADFLLEPFDAKIGEICEEKHITTLTTQ